MTLVGHGLIYSPTFPQSPLPHFLLFCEVTGRCTTLPHCTIAYFYNRSMKIVADLPGHPLHSRLLPTWMIWLWGMASTEAIYQEMSAIYLGCISLSFFPISSVTSVQVHRHTQSSNYNPIL